jgi:nitrogen fixation NifU-like protein
MDPDLKELYQQTILDHNRSPRNFGKLPNSTHSATGDNPLCGDHIDLFIQIQDDTIKDIHFEGKGCAISKASASLMTTVLKGKRIDEARKLFESFHKLLTQSSRNNDLDSPGLGKLQVFSGVREFPIRVKCATLAWHTFLEAIEQTGETVSTE